MLRGGVLLGLGLLVLSSCENAPLTASEYDEQFKAEVCPWYTDCGLTCQDAVSDPSNWAGCDFDADAAEQCIDELPSVFSEAACEDGNPTLPVACSQRVYTNCDD